MGSVADKIAKKILSFRGSKVVDLAAWREGREMALEAGFGDEDPALGKLAGHDPCHAPYIMGQNFASFMAESISGMREAKGYVRTVGDAEEEYLPGGPPMSPLTTSHFTMWALFDVRFGSSRETMGSCILPYRFYKLILLRRGLESVKVVMHFLFDTRVRIDRQHPFVARTSQASDSTQQLVPYRAKLAEYPKR